MRKRLAQILHLILSGRLLSTQKEPNLTQLTGTYVLAKYLFSSLEKDAHNAWDETYSSPRIYTWMLTKKRMQND